MAKESEGLGQALRTGREARGLPIERIAESLMLSVSTVRALEGENWNRMPAPVFVRGYIRNYARLVGLNEDALLSRYEGADNRVTTDQIVQLAPISLPLGQRPALWFFIGAVVLLLLLVAAVGWFVIQWTGDETAVAETAAQPSNPDPVIAVNAADLVLAASAEGQVADAGSASPTSEMLRVAEDGGLPPASAAVEIPADRPIDQENVQRLTPTGDAELWFQFSEDCWVEVKGMNGDYLYADLGRPEQTLRLVGEGPFDVKLGYAPGVNLLFNGVSVPLAPHTRDYVATLVLGY